MESIKTGNRTIKSGKFRIQPYRKLGQFGFLAIILLTGIQFAIFVHQLEKGLTPTVSRPPGVEGFLPIAAMISLKYWLVTGVFNPVHPAGLVLLLLILLSALLLKKGFCSWVCPFGLLSEYLAKIHTFLFKKRRDLPRWLDYPL
ncbi:MAG: 4Fe-4S binding protein, partial [Planctomycetota bacterium]